MPVFLIIEDEPDRRESQSLDTFCFQPPPHGMERGGEQCFLFKRHAASVVTNGCLWLDASSE